MLEAPISNMVMFGMRPTMESTIDTVSVSPADGALIRFCTSLYKRPGPPGLTCIQAP
jgi:hypothetical protein